MEQGNPNRNLQRVSAALAAAQAQSAMEPVRFPGEDGGRSLAEMAQRDLDAALQLLADRAQYITGATGAAIALRRDGRNDMLCRASTGTNAPELGALLSTEFGLSGESVRTKRPMRCDDAERDSRVNREVCRQMGIASVVVMPVVHDDHVLGVFELFSGKANAFGERDLSAVQRLSQMVEAAVRLANATHVLPTIDKSKTEDGQFVADLIADRPSGKQKSTFHAALETSPAHSAPPISKDEKITAPLAELKTRIDVQSAALPSAEVAKKQLFWTASETVEAEISRDADSRAPSNVPPVLRGLKKCEACGFPVSAGRALCVECEEKKWKGELRPRTGATPPVASKSELSSTAAAASMAKIASVPARNSATSGDPAPMTNPILATAKAESAPTDAEPSVAESRPTEAIVADASTSAPVAVPDFVLSAGIAPSQSWFARNKYVLGVLIAIACAATAVYFLR